MPDPAALRTVAREEREAGRLEDAEASCRAALGLAPDDADAHRLLGTILQEQRRGVAAIRSFRRAVALDPRSAKALAQLAIALAEQGEMAEAIDCDRRALALDPLHVGALCHLARAKRFHAGDADLARLEAVAQEAGSLSERQQVLLFFALAKAYEDVGGHARSFEALERANDIHRSSIEYDVSRDIGFFEAIASVFDGDLFARFAGAGAESDVPILIVGMPRSGTTLVEQILASHPAVQGAGELGDLQQMSNVVPVLSEEGLGFPHGVAGLSGADLAHLGHGYVARLRRLAPGSPHVTDKAPMNFRYLGLAHLILPQARIIHCMRDPADTCLSCYGLLFNGVDFSYDLVELGRYYRAYAELMDHWREVIPGDRMLEVRYEDLVADVGREARRLVAHCGLEWDDACLAFHATERTVRTASFAQVRRPVYRDSVGRWRRYEPHLRPLLDALEAPVSTP